jgi:hypothetical protein
MVFLPPGYEARPVASINPQAAALGVACLEEQISEGQWLMLDMHLSHYPPEIGEICSELRSTLASAGVRTWAGDWVSLDSDAPIIHICYIKEQGVGESLGAFFGGTLGKLLLALLIGLIAFAIMPESMREMLSAVVMMMPLLLMMYFVTSMMKGIYPIEAGKRLKEKVPPEVREKAGKTWEEVKEELRR